jgi:hypothetical protein
MLSSHSFNAGNTNIARSSNPVKAPQSPPISCVICFPFKGASPFGAMPSHLELIRPVTLAFYRDSAAQW